ncbi:MAG: hypothetical protein KDE31_15215, partial [Caldilineaceae bacterium]|nr:hypothetical protein [Caldilineaceae bacterium]
MLQAIRQRVRIHDRYQLEIKIEYPVLPSKRTHYHLNTYLFIPHNLAINELSYPTSEFYRRLQNYIRFKTPVLSAAELLHDPVAPLQLIDRIWQKPIASDDPETVTLLVEQFKLLRAILRRTLDRRLQKGWRKATAADQPKGNGGRATVTVDHLESMLTEHVAVIEEIVARFRRHQPKVEGESIPERLQRSYRLTDEAISVVIEGNLLHAMRLVAESTVPELNERLAPLLATAIQNELAHRQQQGYRSLLLQRDKQKKASPAIKGPWQQSAADEANERYLYHLSLLKKYTSSVLYLSSLPQAEDETVEHLLFALAAGISMIFATLLAFYAQSVYGNFTASLFIALVVGYMFKDRIKEIGRSRSKSLLRRYFYDRRVYISTLDRQQRLGRVREKMTFLREQELPTQVKAAYTMGQISPIEIDGYSEHIIRYSRNVRLIADAFRKVR